MVRFKGLKRFCIDFFDLIWLIVAVMATLTWMLIIVVAVQIGWGATKAVRRFAAERKHARLVAYIANLPSEDKEAVSDLVNQSKHTVILNPCSKTTLGNGNVMVSPCYRPRREAGNGDFAIPIDLWLAMVEATPKHHKQTHTQSA